MTSAPFVEHTVHCLALCPGSSRAPRNRVWRLVFDQSVEMMLRPVFARRHFKNIGETEQCVLRVPVRYRLQ